MYQDLIQTLTERRKAIDAAIGALEALNGDAPKVKARPRVRGAAKPASAVKTRGPRGAFAANLAAVLRASGKPLPVSEITNRLLKGPAAGRVRSSVETQIYNLLRRKANLFRKTPDGVVLANRK